jgi:hypothetical protein
VGLCQLCKGIDPDLLNPATGVCSTCGARQPDDYQVQSLCRPLGFRTHWDRSRVEPYEGSNQRISRAAAPKLTFPTMAAAHTTGGLEVRSAVTRLWTVNDAGGYGFPLARSRFGDGGWVLPDEAPTNGVPDPVALGAVISTDVLVARPAAFAGAGVSHQMFPTHRTDLWALVSTARRAAWTSFAFLLRQAAGLILDVEPEELVAGIRVVAAAHGGPYFPEIFLADAIENGAGFVTQFADPAAFADLLAGAGRLVGEWDQAGHGCDSSCPSCLRDWSNAPWHPILDWRLAADTFEVLTRGGRAHDRWAASRASAVAGLNSALGWNSAAPGAADLVTAQSRQVICLAHPLADIDADLGGRATPHGPGLVFDIFTFDRRPGEVIRLAGI